ncbi:hypothetical protein FXF51_39595 [Nonomuraea sp. PA05]|nr:hypothetical protein FXF51_39595 [Nonomuraea sp. PA05]
MARAPRGRRVAQRRAAGLLHQRRLPPGRLTRRATLAGHVSRGSARPGRGRRARRRRRPAGRAPRNRPAPRAAW